MDYSLEGARFNLQFSKDFNNILFEQMEFESDMLVASMESFSIIMEADTEPLSKSAKSLWQKIKDFFKRIFSIFKDKASAMLDRDKEWLERKKDKLKNLNFDGIKLDMVPLWEGVDSIETATSIDQISSRSTQYMGNKVMVEKLSNIDEYKKVMCNKYLDDEGNLTNGFKNYIRTGNPKKDIEVKTIEGTALKSACNDMIVFCEDYSNVVNKVEKSINYAEQTIQKLEGKIKVKDNKTVKESYLLLEECTVAESSISHIVLLEADNNDDKPKVSDVKVTNENDKEEKNESDKNTGEGDKKEPVNEDDALDALSASQLKYLKNVVTVSQTLITCLMTVSEETYKTYMKALRALYSTAPSNGKKEDGEDKKDTSTDNKDDKSKEEDKKEPKKKI